MLRVVDGPTSLPLTLAQVKAHLRVDDNDEDTLIETYLRAAVGHAERFLGQSLIDTTWDYYFDAFPANGSPLYIPRAPLIEVLNVEAEGAAFADYLPDYSSLPGRIYLATGASWPTVTGTSSVGRIRFRAGYVDTSGSPTGEVPADILAAILLIVGTLYAHRETIIVGQAPAALPWSAEQLLRPYRTETSIA